MSKTVSRFSIPIGVIGVGESNSKLVSRRLESASVVASSLKQGSMVAAGSKEPKTASDGCS